MANYLGFVSIQVRDLERSKQFYGDQLGLEIEPGPAHAVVFAKGNGVAFAIRQPIIDLDSVPSLGAGVALWFTTSNVDVLYQNLSAANVKILQLPQPSPFGKMMVFVDPDGYTMTVHQQ